MIPVTLGLGLINVNALIDTLFASRLINPDLAPTAIDEGLPRLHAPAGDVLGRDRDRPLPVALATRGARRHARLRATPSRAACGRSRSCSSRRAVVSAVLAEPIIRLLYQRGAFTPEQTPVVAAASRRSALGLVFNGTMLMLNRASSACRTTGSPTAVALGNLGLNAALDVAFYRFGTWGIPLATSLVEHRAARPRCSSLLRRRLGRIGFGAITVSRSCASSSPRPSPAVVAFAVWWPLDDAARPLARRRSSSRSARRSLLAPRRLPGGLPARSGCARCRRYSPCAAASRRG